MLADLKINNQTRKVIMQANKNGYFYVLDRANGKIISASPFAQVNWATSIDLKTGRPMIAPPSTSPTPTGPSASVRVWKVTAPRSTK